MSLTLLGIIVFVIGVVIVLVNMVRLVDSTMNVGRGFGTTERMERKIRSGFRVHMLGAGVVFSGVILFVIGLLQHFNVL
jgi:hypothetical protein